MFQHVRHSGEAGIVLTTILWRAWPITHSSSGRRSPWFSRSVVTLIAAKVRRWISPGTAV